MVGQSPAHHDFVEKVEGALHYADDWRLPGMLHGRIVRSQLPCARITGDRRQRGRARSPASVAVLTAERRPAQRIVEEASGAWARARVTMPVLAADRVRYQGEPVALVAAETQQIAAEAAELVVGRLRGAARRVRRRVGPGRRAPPRCTTAATRWSSWQIRCGDADAGAGAPPTWWWRATYRSQHVDHAYLEPEAGVGWVDATAC